MLLLRVALFSVAALLAVTGGAKAWDEIQPAVTRDAAECVSWSANRIDCFARTPSGSLSWVYRENGKWSAPHDLGGKLAAAPSCVVRGPGGINCFATSAKGVLATIYLNGSTWGKWASLGGELKVSRVSCVNLGRDRIVCFARGRADQLVSRRWFGGQTWEPWRDLGGALGGDPECVLVGGASAACFVRSAAGELVAFLPDAAGRSGGWTTLGGRVEGKPSCVRLKSGEAACAIQSRSSRLQMWRGMPIFGENTGLITSIDDTVTVEPACALQGATLVCFTRNSRRQLVRHVWGEGDPSRDVVNDAPQVAAIGCVSVGENMGCALTDAAHKLQFAAIQDLAATTPQPAPAAVVDENVEGPWYLANLANGGVCRVHLAAESLFGAKLLRAGPRCRVVDLPARLAQWDQSEGGLTFFSEDGRILLRFHSPEPGRWMSAGRDGAYQLSREPPGDRSDRGEGGPPPEDMDELSGAWRVIADDRGEICTVRLTTARVDEGFAVRWDDPACDDRFAGIRYWAETGTAFVLVGRDNVLVARFDSAGPGVWHSPALGGLTLKR
jgi:hypothetical protein